jgi:hypothetical protein
MAVELGIVVVVISAAICGWLSVSALNQVRQLRAELDETQRQVNELRQAAEAAAATPPAPPPLPRARGRSGGLDDLREQLRASHRDDAPPEE